MSLLERRPVRDFLKLQDFSEIRPLGNHLGGFPVVGLEELPQRQHREMLGLVEIATAELGREWREPFLADRKGSPRQIQSGLGHGGHALFPLSMTNRSAFS